MKRKFLLFFSIFIMLVVTFIGPTCYADAEEAMSQLVSGTGAYETIREIVNLLFFVGMGICVIKLMHIGVKFITNAAGKGNAKEALLPWFIGAVLLALFWPISTWIISSLEPASSGTTNIFDI
jgi:hypothetical protein